MATVNSSSQTIYNKLLPKIGNLYLKYKFLKFSSNELKDIVIKAIDEYKIIFSCSDNFEIEVINYIDEMFMNITRKRCENKKDLLIILDNYICLYLNNDDIAVNLLSKFTMFLREFDIIPDPDIIIELSNNKIFSKLLTDIYLYNGGIENRFNDDLLNYIYDTFYLFNDSLIDSDDIIEVASDKLDFKEERKLFNDKTNESKKVIIEKYGFLVPLFVNKYFFNRGVDIEDLIQEGYIGLMMAVKKYNLNKDYCFYKYATSWIEYAVTKALLSSTKITGLRMNDYNKLCLIKETSEKLERLLRRKPSLKEIAEELYFTEEEVDEYNKIIQDIPLTVNYIDSDNRNIVIDFEESEIQKYSLEDLVLYIFNNYNYSESERKIISLRFGLFGQSTYSLEELEIMFNISRDKLKKIINKTLDILKNNHCFKDTFDFRIKGFKEKTDDKNSSVGWKSKNFYERVAMRLKVENTPKFRKKLFDLVMGLDDEIKSILIKRYGKDLNDIVYYEDWSSNDQYRVNIIINKLVNLLIFMEKGGKKEEYGRKKNIYELLSHSLKEDNTPEFKNRIDSIISKLDEKQKNIIVRAYGTDLSTVNRSFDWNYKKELYSLKCLFEIIKRAYFKKYKGINSYCSFINIYSFLAYRLDVEDTIQFMIRVKKALFLLSDDEILVLKKIYGDTFLETNKRSNYSSEEVEQLYLVIEKLLSILKDCSLYDTKDYCYDNNYLNDYILRYTGNCYDFKIICDACDMLYGYEKYIVKRLFGINYDLECSINNVLFEELNYFNSQIIFQIILNIEEIMNNMYKKVRKNG